MINDNLPAGFREDEGNEISPEQEDQAYNDYMDQVDLMVSEEI